MQEKSHNLSHVFGRIDHLRIVTNQSWDQIAAMLGCDRSMFFHVKSGRRNLSKKALFRLEEVERAAGILPPPPPIDVIKEDEEPPAQKDEIISDREELRAIAIELRDLCTRINRLEERMNK